MMIFKIFNWAWKWVHLGILISLSINLDLFDNAEDSNDFHPKDYDEDINYIRKNTEYKMEGLLSEFLAHKIAFNNAQTLISISKSKLEKAASTNSSRSSSPVRSYIMRSNADSMKPSAISYSAANLINVKEHMRCVDDWISYLYPNGYSFNHFKSNFTSTIDIEFSIKAKNFK